MLRLVAVAARLRSLHARRSFIHVALRVNGCTAVARVARRQKNSARHQQRELRQLDRCHVTTFLFWSLQISDISNLDSQSERRLVSPVHLVGKPLNPDSPGACVRSERI